MPLFYAGGMPARAACGHCHGDKDGKWGQYLSRLPNRYEHLSMGTGLAVPRDIRRTIAKAIEDGALVEFGSARGPCATSEPAVYVVLAPGQRPEGVKRRAAAADRPCPP